MAIKTFAIVSRRSKMTDGTPGTRRDSFDFPILALVHAGQLELRDRHGHRVRTEPGEPVTIALETCKRDLPWVADPGVKAKRATVEFPIQVQRVKDVIEIRHGQGKVISIPAAQKVEIMPACEILTEEPDSGVAISIKATGKA